VQPRMHQKGRTRYGVKSNHKGRYSMLGTIVAYDHKKLWGFIEDGNGVQWFFHKSNSPHFIPRLGAVVDFQTAAPFKLGRPDQAVNLRLVEGSDASKVGN
jgi:hypothetical protein